MDENLKIDIYLDAIRHEVENRAALKFMAKFARNKEDEELLYAVLIPFIERGIDVATAVDIVSDIVKNFK